MHGTGCLRALHAPSGIIPTQCDFVAGFFRAILTVSGELAKGRMGDVDLVATLRRFGDDGRRAADGVTIDSDFWCCCVALSLRTGLRLRTLKGIGFARLDVDGCVHVVAKSFERRAGGFGLLHTTRLRLKIDAVGHDVSFLRSGLALTTK